MGRRHFRAGGGIVIPADVATLVAALGGTSQVIEFWDTRTGISLNGATVASWTGMYAGFVLQQPTAANQPAWSGANTWLSTTTAKIMYMASASPLLDISQAMTVLFGGHCNGGGGGRTYWALTAGGSIAECFQVEMLGSTPLLTQGRVLHASAGNFAATGYSPDLTRKTIMASKPSGSGNHTCQVLNQAAATAAFTAPTSQSYLLTIGSNTSADLANNAPMDWRFIIIMPVVASGGQMTSIDSWAVATHGIVDL